MEIKKERLLYIDQLKGIAIIIVVMGHFIQYNTVESTKNSIFGIIYSFHMPLFMFISGYVAYKTIKQKDLDHYLSFLNKKALAILLPFFSWPLIVNPFFFNNSYKMKTIPVLISLVTEPMGALWFLWFLFWLYILYTLFFYLSNKLNKKQNLIIDISICALTLIPIVIIKFLNVINYTDSFVLYYIFFFFGVFISKHLLLRNMVMNNLVFATSMIYFIMVSGFYKFNGHGIMNMFVKLSLSVAAIITIYTLVTNIHWTNKIDQFIQDCGRNSLVIYVTHFSIINVLTSQYLIGKINILLLFCITTSVSILVIAACLIIMRVVQVNKFLDLLLYGRKR